VCELLHTVEAHASAGVKLALILAGVLLGLGSLFSWGMLL
jgi:hypothetical protein